MRSKFKWIFTLILALTMQFSFAQEKTITGTVSESGQPLPGVTVSIKGTTQGTQTDFDGNYSIKAKVGAVLQFTYMGMKSQAVTVGTSNVINVNMVEEENILNDVVVEAYRTTTKATTNVAVTTVSAKTIESRPNASVVQTLQGQIPGLDISTGTGQPGGNSLVVLRGNGSINGNIEPLFVVDGVPLNTDTFRSINPNDIESISVLKDAGATSIYGNRGANGVIVITTKNGAFESDLQVKFNSISGFSTLQNNNYRLAEAKDLLRIEKMYGSGLGATLTDEQINAYAVNTDWRDVFFRHGAFTNNTVSLTSGGKNISAFTSFGFLDQEGIAEKTGLKRFNFRNNVSGKSKNGRFTYGTSLTINYSVTNNIPDEGTGYVNSNPLMGITSGLPYYSPSWYQGGEHLYNMYTASTPTLMPAGDVMVPIRPGTMTITPLMLMDRISNNYVDKFDEIKAIANVNGAYKITDDLTFGSTLGLDMTDQVSLSYTSPQAFNSFVWWQPSQGYQYRGRQTEQFLRHFFINTNTRLNYNKTFAEKHTLDASLFTEYYKAHANNFSYTQTGLDPRTSSPGAGTGFIAHDPAGNPRFYVPGRGSGKAEAGLFSYFGSVDYDYDSRFGFGATVRRDASYRFNTTNRWGTFWSVSGRWNIDREAFMEGSVFNMLKLRASYGTAGNQNITGQSIFSSPNLSRTLYGSGRGYGNQNAYVLAQLGNDDLRWETITQANIGIDFSLLERRLNGNLDFYNKRTSDLFLSTPLSAVTGFGSLNTNDGELNNKGIEALISYDLFPSTSDFKLRISANAAYNKSEVIKVPNEDRRYDYGTQVIQEGRQLYEFYVIRYAGVNPANGNLLYYTADGLVTENPNPDSDRVLSKKTPIAPYQGAFSFDADYKGFFLTAQFNWIKDIWRIDDNLSNVLDPTEIGVFTKSTDLFQSWTPDNRDTHIPSMTATNINQYDSDSDRFLVDASYLRLRYLSLGYNFNAKQLERTFLSNLRIYGQVENLYTWTKWRGWDAESTRSGDFNNYPTPRTISFGLELQF